MMLTGDIPASPAAISICAPYGNMPCVKHEAVSNMLALFLLSTPYFSAISLAIGPVVIIATVLFAVHIFTRQTSKAMLNSALLLSSMFLVSLDIR